MTHWINKFEGYKFEGFGGVDNCDYCDNFTHVNEWTTHDGAPHFVCNLCEVSKRFPEKR